jgi:endonuclease YncB( thermonuclease family)
MQISQISQTRHLFFGWLFLALTACAQDGDTVLRGKVTRVTDGDTATVRLQSGAITVRFYGIDAPERDQIHGKDAGRALRQLINGKVVDLLPVEQDKYDRLVAVVMLGERNINREMVAAGNAWAFRQFLGEFADDPLYCEQEARAREQRLGLWRLPPAQRPAPWEWRRREGRAAYTSYAGSTAADCVAAMRGRVADAPIPRN